MADIKIVSNEERLQLDFFFYSPQQFYFGIFIKDSVSGDQIFHDEGRWNGKKSFDLGIAEQLVDKLLIINWTIIDPSGADHNFSAEAIVSENGTAYQAHQICKGKTNNSAVNLSTSGKFIV